MSTLPKKLEWEMAQDRWASLINPILTNPALDSSILKNVSLAVGNNVINHKLGRKLQGWRLVRQRAQANIWDEQDSNQMQDLTLVIASDAIVNVDIEVF